MMLRYCFISLLLTAGIFPAHAQKLKKADKIIVSSLQQEIGFLASDSLEGRRTGSAGEKRAADYIAGAFAKSGLSPKGEEGSWLQPFEVFDGRQILQSHFTINNAALVLNQDYIPLSFSGLQQVQGNPAVALQESGEPWFIDLKDALELKQRHAFVDMMGFIHNKTRESGKKGATAVIFYNSSKLDDEIVFDKKDRSQPEAIPVFYVTARGRKKYLKDESLSLDISLGADIKDSLRTGHNVIGWIDNKAPYTVVIGAHYDHLGYGEDSNSLYRGSEKMIHPGADDNASGVSGMLELAKLMAHADMKTNYLFIAFSGEELGLFGSHYFAEHPTLPWKSLSYMINLDMIGRLNDSTHLLFVGGYGTSPQWAGLLADNPYKKFFTLKFDSSGTGPSDHTSFYIKNIPVLFFFTGIHRDYHRPTDVAGKINYAGELEIVRYIYSLTEKMDGQNKPAFRKTAESPSVAYARFSVTLGIMPDYSFQGTGVRIDGISEGRPAMKAGLQAGDVILKLGDFDVSSLESYMKALGEFKKGDATTVDFKRGNDAMHAGVMFD